MSHLDTILRMKVLLDDPVTRVGSALLTLCLGVVVSQPSILPIVLWICSVITLIAKSRYEERLLARTFPDYPAYKSRTWQFMPYVI